MQSERTLRRKIKKELDSLQMLNSNTDSIEVEEIYTADTSYYTQSYTPSISTSNLSQTVTIGCQNISYLQEVSSVDSNNETLNYNLTDENHHSDGLVQICTESIEKSTFKDDLCRWVVECDVPQTTVNKLLHFMKLRDIIKTNELPWDCRTLLSTPRSIIPPNIQVVEPGHYYHFGLAEGIIRHASSHHFSEIKLMIGIDGLPIAKSSNSQLWPILAYIENTT